MSHHDHNNQRPLQVSTLCAAKIVIYFAVTQSRRDTNLPRRPLANLAQRLGGARQFEAAFDKPRTLLPQRRLQQGADSDCFSDEAVDLLDFLSGDFAPALRWRPH